MNTQRIGQRFERRLGKMTYIYTIEGIEMQGDAVMEDSYRGKKTIIYEDLVYTEEWYSTIEHVEDYIARGLYKQLN